MPSYVDTYFGSQAAAAISGTDSILEITDGDLTVDLTQINTGWFLMGPGGWAPQMSRFKAGGTYAQSSTANGNNLKHTAFDNVVETWRCGLHFHSANDLIFQIDKLTELLTIRAPRGWTDRRYNRPVYIRRKLSGEQQVGFTHLSQGQAVLPDDFWDNCTLGAGRAWPIMIVFQRQPFWTGAIPGQVQSTVQISATQDWDYDLVWAEEDTTPTGQVFAFGETTDGTIYAGGASEILVWSSGSWAAATTAPVTLTADVTAVEVLANGDVLFGEDGRIILLSSGTYSVETSLPTGQVEAILEASDGQVYAADDGRILKRDRDGVWAEDDDLPGGQVYSLAQSSSGRVFAGEVGQILRTRNPITPVTVSVKIGAGTDDAEEQDNGTMVLADGDLDFFQTNTAWLGLRFQSVAIPNGATINSAVVRLTAQNSDTGTPGTADIFCEDVDDATTFTSTASDISNRTTTTASVSWEDEQNWIRDQAFDTPDISAVVQEVIDRAGWATGQDLNVIFQRTAAANDRDAYSFDGVPGKAAELRITYSQARAAGETWEVNTTLPGGNVRSLLAPSCSSVLLAGDDGQILSSDDDGVSWIVVDTNSTNETRGLYQLPGTSTIYAGDNGNILISKDCGKKWVVDSTLPTAYSHDFIQETATEDIRAGDDGRFLIFDASLSLSLGRTFTDADEVFAANHHKTANLTDILIDNGGSFSAIYPMTALPTALLPAVPAVNDALYFGVDTSLTDSGPFNNVVFDISTPAVSTTSYTITWEYYNGSWVTLATQDGSSQLSEPGVQSVHWKQPSDWATVAVNSITGYWVRARLSALTGTLTPPVQQNRSIYSAVTPFVEVGANAIEGVVNALAKLELRNRSDNGGPGGSEPTLYQTRYLIGLKPTADHANFRAFINFAGEQNPPGISMDTTVDADSATAEQADSALASPTGRRVFFDASTAQAGAGLDNLADRVKIAIDTDTARDYYGTYRAFLRCQQSGGSAGEVSVRLKVVSGSGGISLLTDTQVTQSTTDHELIEFETPITLPISALFTEDDIGDETGITVQISASQSDADLFLYDLFLLPTDVMWVDTSDTANTALSAIGNNNRLVVDSITIPRLPIRSLVQETGTGALKSSYLADSNGALQLIKANAQRLWFMSAKKSAVGGAVWISEPEECSSVRLWQTARYVLGRGLG